MIVLLVSLYSEIKSLYIDEVTSLDFAGLSRNPLT